MLDKMKNKILSAMIKAMIKKKVGLELNINEVYIKSEGPNRIRLRIDLDADKDQLTAAIKSANNSGK